MKDIFITMIKHPFSTAIVIAAIGCAVDSVVRGYKAM